MSNPINSFNLTGTVTKDVHLFYSKTGVLNAQFTISVIDGIRNKANFITIIAVKKTAEKCALFCLKGNVVAVSGEIIAEEAISLNTGTSTTQIFFMAYDVMPIIRITKKKISTTELKTIKKTFEE